MYEMDLSGFSVTIVGIGLLGGSLAMAIRELNPENIWGVDTSSDALDYATDAGIIDKGFVDPKFPLKRSDLVLVCVYPEAVNDFLLKHTEDFKENAIITDIAGVKTSIAEFAEMFPRDDVDIICGHPMAGNEQCGVRSATAEIFKDASYILTPLKRNKAENLEFMEKLVRNIGFESVKVATPYEHDRIIALTSQIPHIMAVALVNSAFEDVDLRPFVGGSYRDSTRVAKINSELWTQLIMENRENVLGAIDLVQENLNEMREAISGGDSSKLSENLQCARQRREGLF
ncbi:prephenate dehydrogenase [Desulfitispora alkaliphila]|uniref:prephenate dehydrogenase n=1 Tax=Desulfitispora alkaliphila TaxID=622674 RepID=UPI003D1B452F